MDKNIVEPLRETFKVELEIGGGKRQKFGHTRTHTINCVFLENNNMWPFNNLVTGRRNQVIKYSRLQYMTRRYKQWVKVDQERFAGLKKK
jgi:hypothetical protein